MSKHVPHALLILFTLLPFGARARDLAVIISVVDGVQVENAQVRAVKRAVRRSRPELQIASIKTKMRQVEMAPWDGHNDTFPNLMETKRDQARDITAELQNKLGETLGRQDGQIKLLVIHAPAVGPFEDDVPWLFPFGSVDQSKFDFNTTERLGAMIGRVAPDLRIVVLGRPFMQGKAELIETRVANLLQMLNAPQGSFAGLHVSPLDDSQPVRKINGGPFYKKVGTWDRLKFPTFLVLSGAAAFAAHSMNLVGVMPAIVMTPFLAYAALLVDEFVRAVPWLMANWKKTRFGKNVRGQQLRLRKYHAVDGSGEAYELRSRDFEIGTDDVFACQDALEGGDPDAESSRVVPKVKVRRAMLREYTPDN